VELLDISRERPSFVASLFLLSYSKTPAILVRIATEEITTVLSQAAQAAL
jgi:hypothetical protein